MWAIKKTVESRQQQKQQDRAITVNERVAAAKEAAYVVHHRLRVEKRRCSLR
jgi:hypothetical protein